MVDGSLILNDRGLGLRYLPLSEVPKNQASPYGEYLFYKDAERFEAVHTLSEDAEHYRFHGSTDPDAAAAAAVEVNARVKTHLKEGLSLTRAQNLTRKEVYNEFNLTVGLAAWTLTAGAASAAVSQIAAESDSGSTSRSAPPNSRSGSGRAGTCQRE